MMDIMQWASVVRRRVVVGYAVAILLTAATTAVAELLLSPVVRRFPFFFYYPALLLSASLGGVGPGIVALLLSDVFLWTRWLDPQPAERGVYVASVLVFSATGGLLSWLMEDLHRSRDRLKAALERERAENTLKDTFLASLSHELRTPLNVVMGRTQMLLSGSTDDRHRQALEAISRNAEAQLRLVEELLDSQRIVQQRFELRSEPVRLDEVARAALDALRIRLENSRLQFSSRIDQVDIVGDAVRLQQVFDNLLGNAITFTDPPGWITLTVKREGDAAAIEVEDSGIGIAPEFLPYVFQRFRQADQSHSRQRQTGLGLGLAICKAIVEAHGGSIAVQSKGLGRGSSFTVRLPMQKAAAEELTEAPMTI